MNNDIFHTEQDSLCWKYFAGEADKDEKKQLLAWVKQSDENKQLFRAAQLAFVTAKHPHRSGRFDDQQAFSAFRGAIRPSTVPMWRRIAVAASVAAIFGIALFFAQTRQSAAPATEQVYACQANRTQSVTLPDGSAAVLHHASRLAYNTSATETRSLSLQGEAFFDVVHNPQKPFVIAVNGLTIKVLGTSFIVSSALEGKAVSVKVLSGRVMVMNGQSSVILTANQSGTYSASATEMPASEGFDKNDIAWKTDTLSFSATPLPIVAEKLGNYFNQKIIINDPSIAGYQLSAVLENPDLDSVLQLIQLTLNIKAEKTESAIVLTNNVIHN